MVGLERNGVESRLGADPARRIRRAGNLDAIQPRDEAVVPIHGQSEAQIGSRSGWHFKLAPNINGGEAIGHGCQNRRVVSIFVAESTGPGLPCGVEKITGRDLPIALWGVGTE